MSDTTNTIRVKILEALGIISDEQYVDTKAKFLIEDLLPVFQQEQLKLLDEVDKEVVGADEKVLHEMSDYGYERLQEENELRAEQRAHLNSIKERIQK